MVEHQGYVWCDGGVGTREDVRVVNPDCVDELALSSRLVRIKCVCITTVLPPNAETMK